MYLYVFIYLCICARGKWQLLKSIFSSFFQDLYLQYNKIDYIHRFAFKSMKALYTLYISNNRLTNAPSLVGVGSTLRILDLSRNYIKHIRDSYFDLCWNIADINFAYNELTQFPNMQNIAKTIVIFGMEGNKLSNANFVYGNWFPKLLDLDLQHNQIDVFCPPPRRFAPRLHYLFLQSNKLSTIYFPYESHRRMLQVFLGNNPWHCNGSLGWTQHCEVPKDAKNNMVCMEWFYLREMVCESPLEAQGLTPKEAANRSGKCR